MAYKYEGFWRAMDTLRDRQVLEEMVERGDMPWRQHAQGPAGAPGNGRAGRYAVASLRPNVGVTRMRPLQLATAGDQLSVLCLGAHSDDIEIGVGATLLSMIARGVRLDVQWCVLSGAGERESEARASAAEFLSEAASARVEVMTSGTASSRNRARRSSPGSRR